MSYKLATGRLKVTVSSAGEVYRGRRFDGSGVIAQVELDGRHRFCQLEQIDPGAPTTGGFGLMAEFYNPEDCNKAQPGEEFLKPGVGVLLKRDNAHWSPYGQYLQTQSVARGERDRDGHIIFETFFAPGWNGYAYRVTRDVWADGATLSIRATMDNLGEKPLSFREYNHNFVSPGGAVIGPEVELRVPGAGFGALPAPLTLRQEGNDAVLGFSQPPTESFFAAADTIQSEGFAWEMKSKVAGLRERVDVPVVRFALWGLEHALTPEVFIAVDLLPGASQTWTRSWDFWA